MAMSGGFAAGLAHGLRSGWEVGKDVRDMRRDLKREKREDDAEALEKELKAIVARGGEQQLQGSGGGMIDVANIEAAPSVDTNQTMGLQQLAAPEQQSASPQQQQPGVGMASDPTVLQQGGASSPVQNPQQQGGLMGAAQPDQPAAPAPGMAKVNAQYGLEPVPDKKQAVSEAGRLSAGLSAAIMEATRRGEFESVVKLRTQQEKIIGPLRDEAYGQARSQFDLTGDPSVFVPFVNDWLHTGNKVDSIERAAETANGMPVYKLKGTDVRTGKSFQQAVSGGQLNSFVHGIADPATHRAMYVDQMKVAYDDAKAQREHNFKLDEISARGTEDRKTVAARGTVDGKAAAPAEVRTAQWLVDQGVAKDAAGAWELVRGARSKPREQYILETSRMLLKEQDPMALGAARMTPERAIRQAEQLYDSLGGGRAQGQSSAPGAAPATGAVEDGYRFKGGNPADPASWEEM